MRSKPPCSADLAVFLRKIALSRAPRHYPLTPPRQVWLAWCPLLCASSAEEGDGRGALFPSLMEGAPTTADCGSARISTAMLCSDGGGRGLLAESNPTANVAIKCSVTEIATLRHIVLDGCRLLPSSISKIAILMVCGFDPPMMESPVVDWVSRTPSKRTKTSQWSSSRYSVV